MVDDESNGHGHDNDDDDDDDDDISNGQGQRQQKQFGQPQGAHTQSLEKVLSSWLSSLNDDYRPCQMMMVPHWWLSLSKVIIMMMMILTFWNEEPQDQRDRSREN